MPLIAGSSVVKTTYLHGKLNCMRQPEGFDDGTGRVCLPIRGPYGYNKTIKQYLERGILVHHDVFRIYVAQDSLFDEMKKSSPF